MTSFLSRGLFALGCTLILQAGLAPAALADSSLRYLNTSDYSTFKAQIPNFPAAGSPEQRADVDELIYLQQTRTPADCARANSIVHISLNSFFGAPYGVLTSDQIEELIPLFNQVRSDLNFFVNRMKVEFGRPRPYTYIDGLVPCVPKDAALAYPSGHTTTSVLEALVLGEIFPQLADRLNARAWQIANDRVLGGVHHPSDIQAGRKLAQMLFASMKTSPAFQADLQTLRNASRAQAAPELEIIGHRGAGGIAPENTLAAFDTARDMGLYDIEFDIQESSEGQLIVYHDGTLAAKTGLAGAVHDHTAAELLSTDIGTWFDKTHPLESHTFAGTKLASLSDVLDRYQDRFFYHIEIKSADAQIPQLLLNMLQAKGRMQNVIVTSFLPEQLRSMRALSPTILLCHLIDETETPDVTTEIQNAFVDTFNQVSLTPVEMTLANVQLAHGLGLSIIGWGVDTRDQMRANLDAGADGMTVDHPEWLIEEWARRHHSVETNL